MFRFDKVKSHQTAFSRQLSEVIAMKKGDCIIMNLKDEYSRCCIPDYPQGERRWPEGGVIPNHAKTDRNPRLRIECREPEVSNDKIDSRRKRQKKISFVRKVYKKKQVRKTYKLKIRNGRTFKRSEEETWYDIKEKAKMMKYKRLEEPEEQGRKGQKRKREDLKTERKENRRKERKSESMNQQRKSRIRIQDKKIEHTYKPEPDHRASPDQSKILPSAEKPWGKLMSLMQSNERKTQIRKISQKSESGKKFHNKGVKPTQIRNKWGLLKVKGQNANGKIKFIRDNYPGESERKSSNHAANPKKIQMPDNLPVVDNLLKPEVQPNLDREEGL